MTVISIRAVLRMLIVVVLLLLTGPLHALRVACAAGELV